MQRPRNILLPLVLGAHSLRQRVPAEKLCTADVEMQVTVKCKLLKSLYCQAASKIWLKGVKYEKENLTVSCSDSGSRGEFDKYIQLGQEGKGEDHIVVSPFKLNFTRENEELKLTLEKEIVSFSLYSLPRSRFVKNDKLEQIIKKEEEGWGPLSMDKSERVMLEPQGTSFPIIGVWISSQQPLGHACNLLRLLSQIREKSMQKCFFTFEGRMFFYLVKLNFEKGVPELFLVEWKHEGKSEKTIQICKKDAFTKSEISLSSDEQAALEFTLRSDEKVPETLLNITCSPIKFPGTSYEETTKSSLPDSPRFRLDRSDIMEQECASLKRLVKSQSIEINDLKAQLLRLAGELRQCKRHKHYCESEDLTVSSSSFRESVNTKAKRLTRSDLNYQQPSQSNCEQTAVLKSGEDNIWDRFEIIQK